MNIKLLFLFVMSLIGLCYGLDVYQCVCGPENARETVKGATEQICKNLVLNDNTCVWQKKEAQIVQNVLVDAVCPSCYV